jgi:RimJ/RimL family protein N-acetyltransferase
MTALSALSELSVQPTNGLQSHACLPRAIFGHLDYEVLTVQPEHVEPIRCWRNAQMAVLRQAEPIAQAQQQRYFAEHIWPTLAQPQPPQILLALRHRGELIGYGGLVHIAWHHRRAEISFLLDPRRTADEAAYANDFSAFLALVRQVGFEALGLRRLFTETYAFRRHHIGVLEANGFQLEGVLRGHVLMDRQPVDSQIHGCLSPLQDPHAN